MGTMQEQLEDKVLAAEREVNNAVNFKAARGIVTPRWVKVGKITHFNRLRADGKTIAEAAKAVGVSPSCLNGWRRAVNMMTPLQMKKALGRRAHRGKRLGPRKSKAAAPTAIFATPTKQSGAPSKTPDYVPTYTLDEVLKVTNLHLTNEEKLELEVVLLTARVQRHEGANA